MFSIAPGANLNADGDDWKKYIQHSYFSDKPIILSWVFLTFITYLEVLLNLNILYGTKYPILL